jgi:hypothetical protein
MRAYGYALGAALLFTIFESITHNLLHQSHLPVMVFLLFRSVSAVVFMSVLVCVNRNARQTILSAQLYRPEAGNKAGLLHLSRAFLGFGSIFFMATALFVYDSQAKAYALFFVHPLFTMMIGWCLRPHLDADVRSTYMPFSLRNLIPVALIVAGAGLFSYENDLGGSQSQGPEILIYLSPLMTAFCYAASNIATDILDKLYKHKSVAVNFTSAVAGLFIWPVFVPFLWLLGVNNIFGFDYAGHSSTLANVCLLAFIPAIANQLLGSAFNQNRDPARITMMDLVAIPLAFFYDFLQGKLNQNGSLLLLCAAIGAIVIGAGWSIWQTENFNKRRLQT